MHRFIIGDVVNIIALNKVNELTQLVALHTFEVITHKQFYSTQLSVLNAKFWKTIANFRGELAQIVECLLSMQEVQGLMPTFSIRLLCLYEEDYETWDFADEQKVCAKDGMSLHTNTKCPFYILLVKWFKI